MKPSLLIVLGLVLPAIAGCRTDPAIPLLERELHRKDREINRLRWQNEDLQDLLNSGQDRPASRDKASDEDRRESSPGDRQERNGAQPPAVDPGKPSKKGAGALFPNMPEGPPKGIDPSSNKSSEDGPALDGDPEQFSSQPRATSTAAAVAASAIPINPSGSSRQVAAIQLDRTLTGGLNSGDRSGDQGLLVVIEPRDAAGRPIDAAANVNVAVLDPALQGDAARVARWNFTAAETASLFRRTGAGGAMHLAMAWPETRPKHNKLHLFVRYLTADGRQLETNQPIEIALPGDNPARWTAADSSRFADPPPEQDPAPRARRPRETPARDTDSPAYMATRTSASNPERPVWSPERR